MKRIVLILTVMLALLYAHEVKQENPLVEFLLPIWEFHDAFHWMIAVLFFGTCYHFRYVASRPTSHPPFCGAVENQLHTEESLLKKLHRYFFWLMLIFILIHASEIIFKWRGEIEYHFALFKPYIYPFTSENAIGSGSWVQIMGNAA